MKSSKNPLLFLTIALLCGCGGGSGGSGTDSPPAASGINVLSITVNGSLCSGNPNFAYLNKPCVEVTICTPDHSACQTIDDILLDTGSYGLRVFKQALSVSLPKVNGGSGDLAECLQFVDGSSDWGPVQMASVILGNEPAVRVPVHVIDSTFGTPPPACQNAETGPATAGFNGVLGVGLFVQDCGSGCETVVNNGLYYSCNGSTCVGTTVTLSNQVQNPVALLPQDNNGVIVQLPGVSPGGSVSLNGSLLLGIGTRSNNVPSLVKTYATNDFGEFITVLNGVSYSSFIDTGSNGLFFPSPSAGQLPDCPFPYSDWFCPSSTIGLSATVRGISGLPSGTVPFQIGNFVSLFRSPSNVFAEIGGDFPGGFDWGLPFHFGRKVYIGIEGRDSSLGSGPYVAY